LKPKWTKIKLNNLKPSKKKSGTLGIAENNIAGFKWLWNRSWRYYFHLEIEYDSVVEKKSITQKKLSKMIKVLNQAFDFRHLTNSECVMLILKKY
jgi:hypothetical protein